MVFRILLRHPTGQEEELERYNDYHAAANSALELQLGCIENLDRRRYLRGQVVRLHNPQEKLLRVQKLLREIDPTQSYGLVICIEDHNAPPLPHHHHHHHHPPTTTEAGRPLRKSAMQARAEMTTAIADDDDDDDDQSSVSSSAQDTSTASDSDFQDDDDTVATRHHHHHQHSFDQDSHSYHHHQQQQQQTQHHHQTPTFKRGASGVRTRRQKIEVESDATSEDGHWRTDHWEIKPQREPLLIPFPDDGTHLIGRARWYRRTW